MKHRPKTPTTCNTSDAINAIAEFVTEFPDWRDDVEMAARLAMAYMILTKTATPDMVSDEEYEFIMGVHATLKEIETND